MSKPVENQAWPRVAAAFEASELTQKAFSAQRGVRTWNTWPSSSLRWGGEAVFTLPASARVVLATGLMDMRKSTDGLMALVRAE